MDRELFDAAQDGNVAEIRRTLLSGADPSLKFGKDEETSLHIACRRGHLDAVRALLVANADVDARDKDGDTALHIASAGGHWKIVKILLEKGADVHAEDRWGEPPLHNAFYSKADCSEVAELLLEYGADVNATGREGKTPLQRACFMSDLQSVKLLVQHVQRYGDVEVRSNHLGTALIDALLAEEFSYDAVEAIAKVLLDSGANVKVAADDGDTALHCACGGTYVETVRRLVKCGANLEARDSRGSTPLSCAARADSCLSDEDEKEIVVKLLLDHGAKVNVAQNDGGTALHFACDTGSLEIARLLLNRGADLEAKDGYNETPLFLACTCLRGNMDIAKELVQQRGADIYSKDEDQKTLFDCLKRRQGTANATRFLLEQYEEKVWEQEGRLSLHAILREATHLENSKVQLPMGTLTADELLGLLGPIHSRDLASIRSQDHNGDLPLHIVCRTSTNAPIKVLRFFVMQDTHTLASVNRAGSLPIHEACRGGASLAMIKYLVKKGGVDTLDARDEQGALPVHVLCQSNPSVDVVKFLVNQDPGSISEETSAGALPFMLACEGSASESVLQFLLTEYPKALADMKRCYSPS